jgi:hypothetical protein
LMEDTVEGPVLAPCPKSVIDGRPGPVELSRQVPPGSSGVEDPEHPVEELSRIPGRTPRRLAGRNQSFDEIPLSLTELVTMHNSPEALPKG